MCRWHKPTWFHFYFLERVTIIKHALLGSIWMYYLLGSTQAADEGTCKENLAIFVRWQLVLNTSPSASWRWYRLILSAGLSVCNLVVWFASYCWEIIFSGDHLLQLIMQAQIRELLREKWGVANYAWLFHPSWTNRHKGPLVLQHLLQAWSIHSKRYD
jgi:hypothetical protein